MYVLLFNCTLYYFFIVVFEGLFIIGYISGHLFFNIVIYIF